MLSLTADQQQLLLKIANGEALKVHRDLEGHKVYRLHDPEGHAETIGRELAESLIDLSLIDSNKKFPAATFWLTETGRRYLHIST
jgi:hypothetical protein